MVIVIRCLQNQSIVCSSLILCNFVRVYTRFLLSMHLHDQPILWSALTDLTNSHCPHLSEQLSTVILLWCSWRFDQNYVRTWLNRGATKKHQYVWLGGRYLYMVNVMLTPLFTFPNRNVTLYHPECPCSSAWRATAFRPSIILLLCLDEAFFRPIVFTEQLRTCWLK